jgi:hypothetical protein
MKKIDKLIARYESTEGPLPKEVETAFRELVRALDTEMFGGADVCVPYIHYREALLDDLCRRTGTDLLKLMGF